jgi:8-oxo-dGTP pyrophosphatase MutT (NUDIX family)
MLQEKSAGVILVVSNGKQIRYLLLHYGWGHWGFPKGNIEAEESALQAAIREAEEETGLTNFFLIDGFKEKIEYHYRRNKKLVHKEVTYFLAETTTEEDTVVLSHEHTGFKWVEFTEAYKLLTYQNTRHILEKANLLYNQMKGHHQSK